MFLNNFIITNPSLLREHFLPFENVWRNVESGLYQECIREHFPADELSSEILSVAGRLLGGGASREPALRELCSGFQADNEECMGKLREVIENEAQKDILYLCILIHIHAGHKRMTAETAEFIRKLLLRKAVKVPQSNADAVSGICAQRFCVIDGTAYHLNASGQIVSLQEGRPLPIAGELKNIRSFAYTDKLGFLAADRNGALHVRNALAAAAVPEGVKIAGVSAYLSHYMLLGEDGAAYTNIKMDTAEWNHLRYVYVGLNSVCGIKIGSGSVVSAGNSAKLRNFTNAARVYTYRDGESRYFVLYLNGAAEDDEGEQYDGVTAAALAQDGYYYASGNTIYKRAYGKEKREICAETKAVVRELSIDGGKLFYE